VTPDLRHKVAPHRALFVGLFESWFFMIRRGVFVVCGLLVVGPVCAAEAGWSADRCGREPAAPTVTATSTAEYNASVDRVTAYEKAARAYNSCVSGQAGSAENAISQEARGRIEKIHAASSAVQQRIAANFSALTRQLTVAGKRLGGH